MTWLRWHVGAAADTKMRDVAREAGTGATPGHCVAVWASLLEHAALQRPRGSIETFDAVACAESFGWPHDLVRRIVHAMMIIGLHDFTRLQAWDKRNPPDSTAAMRQKLRRARRRGMNSERHGVTVSPDSERHGVTDGSHGVTVSPGSERHGVTDGSHGVMVLPLSHVRAEKALALDLALKAPSSFCSTTSTPISKSTVPSQRTARAQASDGGLSADAVWSALSQLGIKPGMFGRFGSGASITSWIERGLTADDLGEAIGRARRARERDCDASPIGLRYLACFVEDVLSGHAERGKPMSWIERGDAIGRAWLEGRT